MTQSQQQQQQQNRPHFSNRAMIEIPASKSSYSDPTALFYATRWNYESDVREQVAKELEKERAKVHNREQLTEAKHPGYGQNEDGSFFLTRDDRTLLRGGRQCIIVAVFTITILVVVIIVLATRK